MIVIIPCGGRKKTGIAPAGEMYTGPYYRACLRYALSLVGVDQIYILSAKHGLLCPRYLIQPYNLKMGQKGSVDATLVMQQAREYGIEKEEIIGLGGKAYTDVLKTIWPKGLYPITGLPMGRGMQWLRLNRKKRPAV